MIRVVGRKNRKYKEMYTFGRIQFLTKNLNTFSHKLKGKKKKDRKKNASSPAGSFTFVTYICKI